MGLSCGSGIPSTTDDTVALLGHIFGCQGFQKYEKTGEGGGCLQSLPKCTGDVSTNINTLGVLARFVSLYRGIDI